MLVDTHAHLDFPEFSGDLRSVIERARKANVNRIVSVGISLDTSRKAIDIAETFDEVYATVGIHPHGACLIDEKTADLIRTLASHRRVVALGEMGLDYYRDRQPRHIQERCLRKQLEIACELKMPAVFHIREAYGAFFEILKDYTGLLTGAVFHCFSGDWSVAVRCLDLGFYLSMPGTITYSKAQMQQDVVRRIPLDRLLLETDAPFLAPVPFRGKTNEPSFIAYTAEKVAQLRACPLEEVSWQTSRNACRFFGINDAFAEAAADCPRKGTPV